MWLFHRILPRVFTQSYIQMYKPGASLVVQWSKIHLAMQRTLVWSWSRKIPHAVEQRSPCTASIEPTCPRACALQPEAQCTVMKYQNSKKKKINLKEKRCTSQKRGGCHGLSLTISGWLTSQGTFLSSVFQSAPCHFSLGTDVFPPVLTPLTSASILQHSSIEPIQVTKLADFPLYTMSGWLPSESSECLWAGICHGYLDASSDPTFCFCLTESSHLQKSLNAYFEPYLTFLPFQNCFSKLHFLYPGLYLCCFCVLKSNMLTSYRFFKRNTNCNTRRKIFLISSMKRLKIKE